MTGPGSPHGPAQLAALEARSRQLDPGPELRSALVGEVMAYAERFMDSLGDAPAYVRQERPGAGLSASLPGESGRPIGEILDLLKTQVDTPGANGASGRHFAFIPPSTQIAGALGDFLAALTNKYAGYYFAGPGAVRMENLLLSWMGREFGLPEGTHGNLAAGGSLAHLVGICAAREAAELKSADFDKACVYLSDQAHHCVRKALRVAGLGEARIRLVPTDALFRMLPGQLEHAIEADRAAGLRPWLLAPTAGTTNSGAVDPLEDCAEIAARHGLWMHTDGAYGAFFALCDLGRSRLGGLGASDSLVADPHKGLFAPMGTGAVLVRHLEPLRRAHAYAADYLPGPPEDLDELSPTEVTLEFSKHARALRLWLPLQLHGIAPFRAALEEKLRLAEYAWDRLAELPGVDRIAAPQLSVMAFRVLPPAGDADAFNLAILEHLQREGRVFLSGTRLRDAFCLRLAVLALRTHRAEVDEAIDCLGHACKAVLGA
jgi:glutamate/tyrosine decarboxylase-like PLP-dependent enzyme